MIDQSQTTVEGYIDHIVYRNEDNGYTVFTLIADGEELTCVGFFQFISEGENVALEGRFTEHFTYGTQFRAETMTIRVPDDAESIERYLGSGAVKGIGRVLAARIVEKFGDDTLRIFREEPERLAEVRGISEKKAREIAGFAAEQEDMRAAMMYLQQFGLSVGMCVRIYKTYGSDMYGILRENPYRLAEEIDGIGFRTADEIASRLGIGAESEYRLRAGVLYTLFQAAAEGHVYLPEEALLTTAAGLLGVRGEAVSHSLDTLAIERRVILKRLTDDTRAVYAAAYYQMEMFCAGKLKKLSGIVDGDDAAVKHSLEALRRQRTLTLDEEQERAVYLAAVSGVFLLTGGPGTGKTTVINEMLRYFEARQLSFLLAAPTGRAARRITEATGYEASTIHRMLEIGPTDGSPDGGRGTFGRHEGNPLEADVIIVDEMSMVDITLFYALLSAVPEGSRLILVGDADQLPSVGPGNVLGDLLRAEVFPTVRLSRIFRQGEGSAIVVNAHAINEGRQIALETGSRDFFFLKRHDPDTIIRQMIGFINGRLPAYVGAPAADIQVLVPMKKGPLGVERLNKILQTYLNPAAPDKAEHTFGERLFRCGDKVMQIRNNYQLEWEIRGRYGIPVDHGPGIFNGDMGIIREINDFASQMTVEFDGGRIVDYPYALQEELELAYAVTIHKSQGSEYPAVIMPLMGGPRPLMTRNLLYTGVTRARKCLVIMGDDETVRQMIDNHDTHRRYTSLDRQIRQVFLPDEDGTGLP